MSTYDDRLAVLEYKVTHLELQRLYDQPLAEKNTLCKLGYNLEEINKDMTSLLSLYTRQSQDILSSHILLVRQKETTDKLDIMF